MATFGGAGDGDIVVNTCGTVRINRCRDFEGAVSSTWSNTWISAASVTSSVLTSTASGQSISELAMAAAADIIVIVSKVVEGAATAAYFETRAFLVGAYLSFGVVDSFW